MAKSNVNPDSIVENSGKEATVLSERKLRVLIKLLQDKSNNAKTRASMERLSPNQNESIIIGNNALHEGIEDVLRTFGIFLNENGNEKGK